MPIFSRQSLRQRLGQEWLRDTVVGNTSGSWGTQTGSINIVDSSQGDPTASGEQMYFRSWLRLLGSQGVTQDLRVGSFNTGSGAFLSALTLATPVYSGMPYELHTLVSPAEKDRAIDAVISDVRIEQELPIWSTPQQVTYSLGNNVLDILDIRYLSDPTNSLNRGEHQIRWFKFEVTATGYEVRIDPTLPASYQLIVDAIMGATLPGEMGTVNLVDEDTILWGAAARCYWLLEQRSPGQEAALYKQRRQEAAREYQFLSNRYAPHIARRIMLDVPRSGGSPGPGPAW